MIVFSINLSSILPLIGSLRGTVQEWLLRCGKLHFSNCCGTQRVLLKSLHDFPKCYTRNLCLDDGSFTYDDEDLDSWEFEAKRWARMFFLVVKEANHVAPVLKVYLQMVQNSTLYAFSIY